MTYFDLVLYCPHSGFCADWQSCGIVDKLDHSYSFVSKVLTIALIKQMLLN